MIDVIKTYLNHPVNDKVITIFLIRFFINKTLTKSV
jgi:hypothetical protein